MYIFDFSPNNPTIHPFLEIPVPARQNVEVENNNDQGKFRGVQKNNHPDKDRHYQR